MKPDETIELPECEPSEPSTTVATILSPPRNTDAQPHETDEAYICRGVD